ncbi:MAG: hypothetical protein MI923_12240 [Phycisphaerales bacterium]|nr:hypothetical protein [Phycisphaerales bacterium]
MNARKTRDCDVDSPPYDVSITIGVDGRLYCHDITPALLPVLSALCGNHDELKLRQNACQELRPAGNERIKD